MSGHAIVVIGRNEGRRLELCLASVIGRGAPVVYVDSGSSDGSAVLAAGRGARVVELDPRRPFSAARARNEGLEQALALLPGLEFVQFVDGDCELAPGWLAAGLRELEADPGLAAVCGRVRERDRDRSIYSRLCDLEWDAPTGETRACGGIAMVRVPAFRQVGGFAPGLIAGEEPELCLRLRRRGWRIRRTAQEMALHDSGMTSFARWWRRHVRGGWGCAEGAALHGAAPERHCVRETLSTALWGAALPLATLLLAWPTRGLSLLLLAGYPVLGVRIYRHSRRRGVERRDALLQAAFIALAKFPQAVGQARFLAALASGRGGSVHEGRVPG